MVEYNLYLMKINNGKFKNFMQPIGLGKEQKRQNERIKNLMLKIYDKNSNIKNNEINNISRSNIIEENQFLYGVIILIKFL